MAKVTRRKAVVSHQDGHRIIQTTLHAADLRDFTQIQHYDPSLSIDDPNQGYQRPPERARVIGFGKFCVETKGIPLTPNSILLSSREPERLDFDGTSNEITFRDTNKLHLVDGQHRTRGLEWAIYEKGEVGLGHLEVPVTIIEGMSKIDEMKMFATVNGEVKSVRTDLVNMILAQVAHHEGEDAIGERDRWKVVASRVVETLNGIEPWQDRIVLPGMTTYTKADIAAAPELAHRHLVRATSFMTSVRPIYSYFLEFSFATGDMEDDAKKVAETIAAFWQAIEEINPDLFLRASEFVLQSTPGIFSLHGILLRLLSVMHTARRDWVTAEFKEMLEPAKDICFTTEFWSKDPAIGEASKFGSMKGFSQLEKLLWQHIKA